MKTNLFKNILLSIVMVILVFSCLEIIQRVRHSTIGYRHIYKNSLGFRGPEISVDKAPGTIRILFVGASTTFGVHNSLENTFPFLVEKFLRERLPDKSIEVINAARPARDSFWVVKQVRDTLYLKPDLIIVMTGHNDVVLMHAQKNTYEVVEDKIIFKRPWHRKIHDFLYRHSNLYVTLKEKIAVLLYGHPEYAYVPFKERSRKLDAVYIKACVDNYKANLKTLIELASRHGIKVIFLKAPVGEVRRICAPHYHECYQMTMDGLDEVAFTSGAPFVDIGTFFNGLKETQVFTDGIHFTDTANRRIALGISEYLLGSLFYAEKSGGWNEAI